MPGPLARLQNLRLLTELSPQVQSRVQDLVPNGDIEQFWTTTVVSYATGNRPGDARGAGPGMYYATAMVCDREREVGGSGGSPEPP